MKTVKKNKFILFVVLSAIMALSVMGALKVNDKTVSAADEEYSISKVEKAQLRLTAEGGLRFRFTVDAATRKNIIDNENVKIQFIIAPEKYFDSSVAEDKGLKAFLDDESDNIYASTTEGIYYVNGCIQNVNVKNVALDFQCMARIVEVGEDGQTVTAVKASALSDARNLYDVVNKTVLLANDSSASAVLDKARTPYSSWFGTEQYPVCVETQAEYDILKTKCNAEGNTSFANVAVAVASGITTDETDFPEANKPSIDKMYTVTFMNGSDVYATVKVKNGNNAAEPSINPRKASDKAFTYTFSGWDGDYSGVTEDTTVTAKYTSALIFDDGTALGEIAEWETAGATKIASALKSSESVYAFGTNNVYTLYDSGYESIANTEIVASNYQTLYLAFMTTKAASLAHGTDNKNEANTWYFVKYEKQDDGSWALSAKKFGGEAYTELTNGDGKFLTGSFTEMFKTYSWDSGYDVYATDVWGVSIADAEIAVWEKNGAVNLGSALESGEVTQEEKFGSQKVYKLSGAKYNDIANKNLNVSLYKTLYLAFKTTKDVGLVVSNGTYAQKANTWYFVRYEKQTDGSWLLYINAADSGKDKETTITPNNTEWLSSKATFITMFKMWNWDTVYDVYTTDVWGVSIADAEIAEWEKNGATEIASALKSDAETMEEKFGSHKVYKTVGAWNVSIANENINVKDYKKLYFAYKTNKSVKLSSGSTNQNVKDTWYFVCLEKQSDDSWKIYAKKVGDEGDYSELEANQDSFSAQKATFVTMFKTMCWEDYQNKTTHDVYASDVWGVK